MNTASARVVAATITGAVATTGASTAQVRRADWRLATVTAANTDGTVDCGTIRARRLADAYLNPAVGDVVVISQNGSGNWICWGRTATDPGTAWTEYTPAWTAATTTPALGNGTLLGRYHRIGRTVHLQINWTAGSSTTYGAGTYSFSLPFTAASVGCTYVGHAHLLQSSSSRYAGQYLISPGATASSPSFPTSSSVSTHSLWSQGTPLTLASGATCRITITYEAAA